MLRPVRRSRLALLAGLLAAVAACREVTVPIEDPASTTYAPALRVDISRMTPTQSGLYYEDVVTGQGAVADSGKTVRTYYTGWLTSGERFDTNVGRTPFQFVLGTGMVIRGWDEGIRGMRVGGRRRLVVPPALGYGNRTSGLIPAGSVLVFDVELVSVN